MTNTQFANLGAVLLSAAVLSFIVTGCYFDVRHKINEDKAARLDIAAILTPVFLGVAGFVCLVCWAVTSGR